MVNYGKEFRKNQFPEWKEKYFDYKSKKKMIKEFIKKKSEFDSEDFSVLSDLETWTTTFEESLDKDIKKVYIFFSNKERILYKQINESLHLKEDYENLELAGYLNEYKQLKSISELSLNMSYFVFYNLKAVIKILKKFDKKVVTLKNKDYQIKFNYIQTKLEELNSDILYLIKFKEIDKTNVILEDLITTLMKAFKDNKENLEDNDPENEPENKLIEIVPDIGEATKIMKETHEQIKNNIQEIDQISANVQKLFFPWKDLLKISGDINNKFIQITRESQIKDISTSDKSLNHFSSVKFSKDSKQNIIIILSHGFIYMFSFSVIIPSYTFIIQHFTTKLINDQVSWAFLMIMTPLGALFNYLYETFLFKKSTKKPIIISCLGLILGNLLYMLAPNLDFISFLFIGRFICGLFNLRTHNKMYIINFLTKKDVSFYLTMFHTASIIGLGVGFLINAGLLSVPENEKAILDKCTIGALISILLAFILLICSCIFFTEAHSNKFNMTSMQMFGDGIISDDGNIGVDEDMASVRKKTNALKDIDSRLGSFNQKSRFDDTNLVSKSVTELSFKEEGKLHYLRNGFIVYFLIIFTTKFINESIYINSFIFLLKEDDKEDPDKERIISIILGCSCLFILIVELSLKNKYKFITERNLIIILLILLLITNLLFIVFVKEILAIYILIGIDTIITSITEKYVAHLFLYIMPENYKICRINGNVFISIFSMLSRILVGVLLILATIKNLTVYNYIISSLMTALSFISFLMYIIFYKDLRIKAINRILKNNSADIIKIATEV